MARRFSLWGLNSTDSPSEKAFQNDETASQTSESTSVYSETSKRSFFGRRMSMSSGDLSADGGEIDDLLKSLYEDPDLLERKCLLSAKGLSLKDIEALDSESYSIGHQLGPGIQNSTKTPETVVGDLPEVYLTENFDPVHALLLEVSDWDKDEMVERFMEKIEDTDTDKDHILSKLADMIEANYSELMNIMRDANAMELDLRQANVTITRGRRSISNATAIITDGALQIAQLHKDKEKMLLIQESLKSLKAVKDIYHAMITNITTGDLGHAAEYACSVLQCWQTEEYSRFKSLETIGTNVQKNLIVIRQKTDKALKRLCGRKFSSTEYANILQAYLVLDYISESLGYDVVEYSDRNGPDFTSDALGCMEGLANRIQRFQSDDIDSCLQNAVLEFIYASQHKKQKAAAELAIAGAYSTMRTGEMMDLAELELEELYERVTPDLVAPCIVRSCECLADVIHTHFLITQWHRAPFSARNEDLVYLHRGDYVVDDDEELDTHATSSTSTGGDRARRDSIGVGAGVGGGVATLSKLSAAVADALLMASDDHDGDEEEGEGGDSIDAEIEFKRRRQERLRNESLTRACNGMLQTRWSLWEQVLQAVVQMLNSITFTAAVPIDDFLAMTWAINAMVTLGREFCGSECRALILCLEEISKEYFQRMHHESFQVLRQMIESEPWRSIPVHLDEMGGVIGIIAKNVVAQKDCAWGVRGMIGITLGLNLGSSSNGHSGSSSSGVSGGSGAGTTVGFLAAFATFGNPLHFMTDRQLGADEESDEEEDGDDEEGGAEAAGTAADAGVGETGRVSQSSAATAAAGVAAGSSSEVVDKEVFTTASDFLAMLTQDDDVGATKRRAQGQGATSMVVTQTALNGLARYAGRYLQLMHLMPAAGAEVFNGLCQLFDFFLCAILSGFVPNDEKQKVLTKPSKMSAPPPDQCKDFEALQTYMERALNDVVHTRPPPSKKEELAMLRHIEASGGEATFHVTAAPAPATASGAASAALERAAAAASSALGVSSSASTSSNPMSPGISPVDVVKVSTLVRVPYSIQESSQDATVFYGLNERIVAAESCWFAAKILSEIKFKFMKLLPDRCLASCESYISQYQFIAGQLRGLIYRAMCPYLIKANAVLLQFLDASAGWDSKKLREEHHDWINMLAEKCREVWEYLAATNDFADASELVREQVWLEMCQAAFDVLLEGFCRVRKCSQEGRGAMTMDVTMLQDRLSAIHPCRPPRGKHYVDALVQASYMPEVEMLEWVREAWPGYAYRHMHGLLTQTLSSMMSSKKLKEAIALIDELYETDQKDDPGSRMSGLFSSRLTEESKLTSIFMKRR